MDSNKITEDTYALHKEAWSDQKKWSKCLTEALVLLEANRELIYKNDIIRNNYAAVLLELHRNRKALSLLKKQLPQLSEAYQNMAIAVAKTTPNDVETIRYHNEQARNLPSTKNAIVAFIDWQGL